MNENNINNQTCEQNTIYTEDFCVNYGTCVKGESCNNCNILMNFLKWRADKSPNKKPFFEF